MELVCNKVFGDFITKKIISVIRNQYNLYEDPKNHVITGCSLGGLMSMFMGLEYPNIFGNVLCQSGSFWAGEKLNFSENTSDDNKEKYLFLIEKYVNQEKANINIYMEIGRYEGQEALSGYPSHLWANRHMRNILRLKEYEYKYVETNTDHSTLGWRNSISEGLIYLFGKK